MGDEMYGVLKNAKKEKLIFFIYKSFQVNVIHFEAILNYTIVYIFAVYKIVNDRSLSTPFLTTYFVHVYVGKWGIFFNRHIYA